MNVVLCISFSFCSLCTALAASSPGKQINIIAGHDGDVSARAKPKVISFNSQRRISLMVDVPRFPISIASWAHQAHQFIS